MFALLAVEHPTGTEQNGCCCCRCQLLRNRPTHTCSTDFHQSAAAATHVLMLLLHAGASRPAPFPAPDNEFKPAANIFCCCRSEFHTKCGCVRLIWGLIANVVESVMLFVLTEDSALMVLWFIHYKFDDKITPVTLTKTFEPFASGHSLKGQEGTSKRPAAAAPGGCVRTKPPTCTLQPV